VSVDVQTLPLFINILLNIINNFCGPLLLIKYCLLSAKRISLHNLKAELEFTKPASRGNGMSQNDKILGKPPYSGRSLSVFLFSFKSNKKINQPLAGNS
jgi:hypothetical protein